MKKKDVAPKKLPFNKEDALSLIRERFGDRVADIITHSVNDKKMYPPYDDKFLSDIAVAICENSSRYF